MNVQTKSAMLLMSFLFPVVVPRVVMHDCSPVIGIVKVLLAERRRSALAKVEVPAEVCLQYTRKATRS